MGVPSAIDGRTTRHAGYAVSQRIRKRIEEAFGWIKTIAGQERTKFRGRERVGWAFTFAAAAYNLARLPKLLEASSLKVPANCRLIGRWRIVEADLWDRAHLDLCGPARPDDHRARRRNRLRRLGGRPRSRIRARLHWLSLGRLRGRRRGRWRRNRRTSRRRHPRDRVRVPKRRRSRPQSETGPFFNSLLGLRRAMSNKRSSMP